MCAEFFIDFFSVTQQSIHLIPESPAVVFDAGVHQFMHYRVIDQLRRQSNQIDVQIDIVLGRAAAPSGFLISDEHPVIGKSILLG